MTRRTTSLSNRRTLRATVDVLRILAPPSDGRRVLVRVVKNLPPDRIGDCDQKGVAGPLGHYLIRLSAQVIDHQPDACAHLLAHEWAHALAWENLTHDHGEAWGMAFARAWRIISNELSTGDM